MPQYFVRIELQKTRSREPSDESYKLLDHAAKDRKMERKLLVGRPDGSNRSEYLPAGFYTISTTATLSEVLELAKDAAVPTRFNAAVVVGEISGNMLVDNLTAAG